MVRICVYLTAEMACEKARLHLKQAPHRHAIAKNRVGYLLIEAPLICRDQSTARIWLEVYGRSRRDKPVAFNFSILDDFDHRRVSKDCSKRLHPVQSQRLAPTAGA